MPLPMFTGKVNYKNSQLVTGVHGGLNSLFNSKDIQEAQSSELENAIVTTEGNLSQIINRLNPVHQDGFIIGWVKFDSVMWIVTQETSATHADYLYQYKNNSVGVWYTTAQIDLSTYNFDVMNSTKLHIVDFHTASNSFLVISSSVSATMLAVDVSTVYDESPTIHVISPPFVTDGVSCVISHANRIFVATLTNNISWTKAGTYGKDAGDWYGGVSTENYVTEDSGFWILEKESQIVHMVQILESIYIFTTQNILVFSGYSAETFSLQMFVSGIGMTNPRQQHPTIVMNTVWFTHSNKLYQFTGGQEPQIVSEPIPSVSTGVMVNGGISIPLPIYSVGYDNIEADARYVYLYTSVPTSTMYQYDFLTRVWTSISGGNLSADGYIISCSGKNTFGVQEVSFGYAKYADVATYFYHGGYPVGDTFLYTSKAFTNGSATQSALSNIWLQYKLSDTTTATDITVSLSRLTTGDTDWTIVWHGENLLGTGDIQTQRIMIPMNMMLTSEFYRIKIECSGALMTLYPYTREVRTKARG